MDPAITSVAADLSCNCTCFVLLLLLQGKLFCLLAVSCLLLMPLAEAAGSSTQPHWPRRLQVGEAAATVIKGALLPGPDSPDLANISCMSCRYIHK